MNSPIPSLFPHVMLAIHRRGLETREDRNEKCPGILFQCPVHADHRPSAKLWLGRDGNLVLGCYACDTRSNPGLRLAIMHALELKPSSFMKADRDWDRQTGELLPESVYDYRDEMNVLRYRACRFAQQKDKDGNPARSKEFKIQRHEKGKWRWGLGDERPLLYRLPQLLATPKGQVVYWCEGENKVESLTSIGLVATSLHGGTDAIYHHHFDDWLRGRHVCFLPDHDGCSEKLIHRLAGYLLLEGVAASVRVGRLSGLCEKQDVWDWIWARKPDMKKEKIRRDLLKETMACPAYRRM